MMAVAVIPARGGSQRIKGKNIRPFLGVPILVRAIETAQRSKLFERIIVSTDSTEIAATARRAGAEVPFMRPAEIADHQTSTLAVIAHALTTLAAAGEDTKLCCCLYPTAVCTTAEDLSAGRDLLAASGAHYALPVTRYDYPLERALRCKNGRLIMAAPDQAGTRTQDLGDWLHDAGQFYWGHSETWKTKQPVFTGGAAGLMIPRWRVVDIDTEEDWIHAELVVEVMQKRGLL